MGLFDNIVCEYALPMPEELGELTKEQIQKANYQTKDFDNFLDSYKICSEGFLWRLSVSGYYEEGNRKAKSIADRLPKFFKTGESWEKYIHTGLVNFYQEFRNREDGLTELKNDYWVEYNASFIEGRISSLSVFEFKKEDNTERLAREAEFKKKREDLDAFLNKWYIKSWYAPWRYVVGNSFRAYRRIKGKLPNDWQVQRFLTPW